MNRFSFTNKLPKSSKWILEFTRGPHSAHLFQVRKIITSQKTKFQRVDIVDLFKYGRTLFLDEKLQVSEKDEFLYHEAISHPALTTHVNPQQVLIIGGADGGTAHQVLKHKSIKELFLVDIDGQLIKICQKFLPEIHRNIFKNKKLRVFASDGRKFLSETKEKFDVIISDLPAPLVKPPSYLLFTKQFYKIVCDKLAKDGLFSLQADNFNHLDNETFTAIHKTLREIFPIVKAARIFIPSYDDTWGFIIASKKYDPQKILPSEIAKRMKNRKVNGLKFYDSEIHRSLFVLPKDLQRLIQQQKRIISDNNPIFALQ